MIRIRRTGLVLAAVATLLWLLVGIAVLTGNDDGDANIGAGLAALLALPLSAAASLTLLFSLRARAGATAGRLTAVERGAGVLAVLSVLCLGAFLVLDPYADSDVVRSTTLAVGVGAFLLSSAGFALTTRGRHAGDGTPVPSTPPA